MMRCIPNILFAGLFYVASYLANNIIAMVQQISSPKLLQHSKVKAHLVTSIDFDHFLANSYMISYNCTNQTQHTSKP